MIIKNYIVNDIEDSFETGIYKIYHIRNENYFYIGSALKTGKKSKTQNGFYNRWYKHFNGLENNKHCNPKLQRYFNKYGLEGIRFKIIEFCTPDKGLLREQFYLDTLKCVDKGLNCSYDVIAFGKGIIFSKERREKISKIHKNKITSEETKRRISESKKGVPCSIERKIHNFENSPNKKQTFLYDLDGNLINIFSSTTQCDLFLGKRKGKTSDYIINKRIMYLKYFPSYEPLPKSFFDTLQKPSVNGGYNTPRGGNCVSLFTKNNIFISNFRTQQDCANYLKCRTSSITDYLKGRTKFVLKNYIVKLVNKTTSC